MNDILRSASVIGRLLEELSWSGNTIRNYRQGGRGYENVLTAEVFQSLDFLPRTHFLGEIVKCAHGADQAREKLHAEVERVNFTLLPGNNYLIPSGNHHSTKLPVQPDGLLISENIYALLEAKRIKSSSFQAEQLAREYVLSLIESQGRQPLLFLILGEKPPIKVNKHGRQSIKSAIELHLDSVLARAEQHSICQADAHERIDEVVSWITWEEIADIVSNQIKTIALDDTSVKSSVSRLALSIIKSIERHK